MTREIIGVLSRWVLVVGAATRGVVASTRMMQAAAFGLLATTVACGSPDVGLVNPLGMLSPAVQESGRVDPLLQPAYELMIDEYMTPYGRTITVDYPVEVVDHEIQAAGVCLVEHKGGKTSRSVKFRRGYVLSVETPRLARLLLHEIGHCTWGLAHVEDEGEIMSPYYGLQDNEESTANFWDAVSMVEGIGRSTAFLGRSPALLGGVGAIVSVPALEF